MYRKLRMNLNSLISTTKKALCDEVQDVWQPWRVVVSHTVVHVIIAFEVLYQWIPVKGRAHLHFVNAPAELLHTADCRSLANKQAEQWKTTINLLHMNLIIFLVSECPSSLFRHNKLIAVAREQVVEIKF